MNSIRDTAPAFQRVRTAIKNLREHLAQVEAHVDEAERLGKNDENAPALRAGREAHTAARYVTQDDANLQSHLGVLGWDLDERRRQIAAEGPIDPG